VKYKLHAREYITIKVWNIYNGNIAVVSFVIKAGRKVIIGVKFKIVAIFKMTAVIHPHHRNIYCFDKVYAYHNPHNNILWMESGQYEK
jgi:hypothetical protein